MRLQQGCNFLVHSNVPTSGQVLTILCILFRWASFSLSPLDGSVKQTHKIRERFKTQSFLKKVELLHVALLWIENY